MILKGVGGFVGFVKETDVLLFPVLAALVLFMAIACHCCVRFASRRSAVLLGSALAALCLLKCQEAPFLPLKIISLTAALAGL